MADAVLFLHRQLGACQSEPGVQKKRIVAEATRATRRAQHFSMPLAFCDQRLRIVHMSQYDDDAIVMCGSIVAEVPILESGISVRAVGMSAWRDNINPDESAPIIYASMLLLFGHSHPGGRDEKKKLIRQLKAALDRNAIAR